jgi:hypothetical protein
LIEHITSITNGGGTTALNVVPGCKGCNAAKDRPIRPSGEAIPLEKIERIREELSRVFTTV